MSDWQEVTLGEIGQIVTGSTPPAKNAHWFGDKYEFITPSDMEEGQRRATPTRWLSDVGAERMATRLVPKDAVCFVCIGATIGKVCMTQAPSVTNQQINSVVVNGENDARFIYYLLRHVAEGIASTVGGAATPIINKSSFATTRVRVPSHPTQRRIGSMLGVIDDLIENNGQRIAVLERMAHSTYREWCVHFRYPGHEDDVMVDSPVGSIPAGWDVVAVSSLVERVAPGARYTSDDVSDSGRVPVIDQSRSALLGFHDDEPGIHASVEQLGARLWRPHVPDGCDVGAIFSRTQRRSVSCDG